MFLFIAFLYISVSSLKFVKGTEVFYAASSDSSVQNSSCIVHNEVLHPCVTLDVLVKDYTFSFATNIGNISIYLIHDKYYIFTNISLFFSNLSKVEIRPWRQKKQANINCEGDFTIECTNVHELYVQSIEFCQCGKLKPVIGLSMDSSTSKIVLKNNVFTKSRNSSVQVLCSIKELHIIGCLFDGILDDYGVYISTSPHHSNNTAAIRDSTFMNNAAGSLYFFSYPIKTILKIQNCNFVNNTVSKNYTGTYGEVIKIYSFSDIYIINCTFIHNSKRSTVVVECPNSNSLCFPTEISAIIHVSNSNFTSNSVSLGGGLFITGKFCIEVYNSVFIGNQVSSEGGVLYIEFSNSLLISNCTFRNNAAMNGGVAYLAEVGSVSIDSSNFTGNKAGGVGGAVYQQSLDLHYSFTNFSNCVFINNSAAFGGAISTHSKYPIEYYRSYTLTVINSSFLNNMASQYGGALSVYWCSVTLYHLTLSGNSAKIEAGALSIFGGKLFIQNCTLTNNIASIGGAMILQYASIGGNTHLSHLKFISNHATFKGGAITLHDYHEGQISVISLTNCSFTNNEVTNESGIGGALALEGKKIQVIMNSCNFTHNNASYGGAVYISRTSCCSKHCTFSENVARAGGAVFGIAAYVDFMNLNMNKNLASENGGGMALSNCSLNISGDSNFTSNTVTSATGRGGAIYIEDRIDDCMTQSCPLFWANNTRLHF